MILVDTFVAGRPATKGSMRVRNRATLQLEEGVVGSGHWRALMAGAVRDAYRRRWASLTCTGPRGGCSHPAYMPCGEVQPTAGPVAVKAVFYLPVDPLRVRAGDLDKLARNLLDALASDSGNPKYNGGVIVNDNQVTHLALDKVGPAPRPGVHIVVIAGVDSIPTLE